MNKIIIKGKISRDCEFDELMIGYTELSRNVYRKLNLDGKKITIKYYISDKEIESEDDAIKRFLKGVYSGVLDNEWCPIYGSSWTGQYGVNEVFKVGGHDLLRELDHYIDKYCLLIICYED